MISEKSNHHKRINPKRSLRPYFIGVIALSYLFTALLTLGIFITTVNQTTADYIRRFSASQNILERNRIMNLIDRDLVLSRKLADDPTLLDWVEDEGNTTLQQQAIDQLESYRRFLQDNTYFVGMAESGSYYVRTADSQEMEKTILERDNPADRWFFESLDQQRPYWINVNYDKLLDEVRVWLNVLMSNSQGNPVGVAGTGLNLSDFLTSMVEHTQPGVESIIINHQGEIIAHQNRDLIDFNARVTRDEDRITIYSLLTQQEAETQLAELLNSLREGAPVDMDSEPKQLSLDLEDRRVTLSVGYIQELGWFNLVAVDAGQIIGVADFLPLMIANLLSLFVVLVVVVLLMNRLVLTPLSDLSSAAEAIARGFYGIRLPVQGNNELTSLSTSFNSMSTQIQKHTQNLEQLVSQRTEELSQSRDKIMDSIRYGRMIQRSVMPSQRELDSHLPQHLIINKPLDTVGGDLPFFRPTNKGWYLAAIDCTGHGVPGAFMTMMVSTQLNYLIDSNPGALPNQILTELHALVQNTLRSERETAHLENGLDMGLVFLPRGSRELIYSGAGLPICITQPGGQVEYIPGDRVHLGFSNGHKLSSTMIQNQHIPLETGRYFYLLTDGILDLPGGDRGFGLGKSGLKHILSQAALVPPEKRETLIRQGLTAFQGHYQAKDDQLLFGFEIPEGTSI